MTRRTIRSWFGNALVLVLSIGFPSGVRADDCNRNGVEDSADLAAGTSEDCNLNEVPDECEVAPVLLVSRDVGVPAPRYPRAIRCADIDGDGDADMITANQAGDTLSTIAVTLGDGEGRFVNHEQSPYDNSVRVSSLEVADLDSDGAPDIVTANFFTLELRWNDGGGGFPESNSIEVDRATRFVTVADLDLDGLPDLIATNTSSDEVIVMMNLGDRDFAESARYFVGEYPVSALAVDVDGDDDLDVVVVNRDSDDLSVLSNDGSGALSDVARVTLAAGPSMVTAADLDHDGTADLVVGAEESVTVLFNDGVGGFGAREHVAPGAATIAARDIDSDGDADLVLGAASHSQVTVLINAQGGLFLRPLVFDTEFSPKMMDVCDIDGDRDLDVVVGSTRTVRRSVLWNKAPRVGMAVPWHQDDGKFWGLARPPSVQIWTALDDAPIDAGPLEVVPGSHLRGLASPEGGTITDSALKSANAEENHLSLPAQRGECILIHNHTWHRTARNRTDHPRKAISLSFLSADTRCTRTRRAPRTFLPMFARD